MKNEWLGTDSNWLNGHTCKGLSLKAIVQLYTKGFDEKRKKEGEREKLVYKGSCKCMPDASEASNGVVMCLRGPVLSATLGVAYHSTAVDRKESPLLDCSITVSAKEHSGQFFEVS